MNIIWDRVVPEPRPIHQKPLQIVSVDLGLNLGQRRGTIYALGDLGHKLKVVIVQ